NHILRKIAKRVFVYFPTLKLKLIELRDGGYVQASSKQYINKNNFLDFIKKDIESKRDNFKGD
ncbi:MAG: hypothetical protein U9N59_08245, partial [Campylobacterota bacterium]|nr:hypothetical protein [Campylobacterota bacterium]